jgi:hypothetical protein
MKPQIREKQYGPFVIGLSVIVAIILIALACSSPPTVYKAPPCCDIIPCEDVPIQDPLLASKCLTCGIHFTHPSYGEHIKTCCP